MLSDKAASMQIDIDAKITAQVKAAVREDGLRKQMIDFFVLKDDYVKWNLWNFCSCWERLSQHAEHVQRMNNPNP